MKQDLLWEQFCMLAYGQPQPPLTASERGRINKALKEIREIGATPEQIKQKWSAYKAKWPKLGNPSLNALVANWHSLGTQARSTTQAYIPLSPAKPTREGLQAAMDLLPKHLAKRMTFKA